VGSAVRRGSGPLDSEVEQFISNTRRMYQAKLQDFLSQAEKREIKLEVKIGVGPAFKEIVALGANWVILDRFVVCAQIVDFFMWILSFSSMGSDSVVWYP
jgi:hypothetical protein